MNSTGETPVTAAVRHWRPGHWPTVTLVLLAAVLALMAVLASQEPSFGWDRAIAAWLLAFSTPAYDAFMDAVSFPGNREGVYVTMLAGAALASWRLGWRAGLLVLVGLALMGVNEVFKDVVDRPRPLEPVTGGGESFPSGHTLHAMLTSGLRGCSSCRGSPSSRTGACCWPPCSSGPCSSAYPASTSSATGPAMSSARTSSAPRCSSSWRGPCARSPPYRVRGKLWAR